MNPSRERARAGERFLQRLLLSLAVLTVHSSVSESFRPIKTQMIPAKNRTPSKTRESLTFPSVSSPKKGRISSIVLCSSTIASREGKPGWRLFHLLSRVMHGVCQLKRRARFSHIQRPMRKRNLDILCIKRLFQPSQVFPSHKPLLDGNGLQASLYDHG